MALPPLTQELLRFLTHACAFGAGSGSTKVWESSHFDLDYGNLRVMGRPFAASRGQNPGGGLLFIDAWNKAPKPTEQEQLSEFLLSYGWRQALEPVFKENYVWHPPESACKKCKNLLACSLANL